MTQFTLMQRARARRASAGVALVTAIFLLVVLAGLATAIVSVMTTQQSSSAKDQLGVEAYQAARAGIEWALLVQLQGAKLSPTVTSLNCPSTSYTFTMPAGTSLSSFKVTVTCGDPGAAGSGGHYLITAVACNENASDVNSVCPGVAFGPDYVQRKVEIQI